MSKPTIVNPGQAPLRSMTEQEWEAASEEFFPKLSPFSTSLQATVDWMDGQFAGTEQDRIQAQQAEQGALAAEDQAGQHAATTLTYRDEAEAWAKSETEVADGLLGAKGYAKQAEAAVGTLPAGTINDSLIAEDKAWSSALIAQKTVVGAPEWPVTLTRDSEGALSEAVFAKGSRRFRQTLNRDSAGGLTSVDYAVSTDSGATYTDIGTETLNRDGSGALSSTSWVAA